MLKQFDLDQMKAAGKTELQIADAMKEIDMSFNGAPLSYLLYFVFSTIAGSIIAIIAALIIRSRKSA